MHTHMDQSREQHFRCLHSQSPHLFNIILNYDRMQAFQKLPVRWRSMSVYAAIEAFSIQRK